MGGLSLNPAKDAVMMLKAGTKLGVEPWRLAGWVLPRAVV